MKNLSEQIIYSDLFMKFPLIRKCYNNYNRLIEKADYPFKLFYGYRLFVQNIQKVVYPIGVYQDIYRHNRQMLIYIVNQDINYYIQQVDMQYSKRNLCLVQPNIIMNNIKQGSCYYRYFSVRKVQEYFNNEDR